MLIKGIMAHTCPSRETNLITDYGLHKGKKQFKNDTLEVAEQNSNFHTHSQEKTHIIKILKRVYILHDMQQQRLTVYNTVLNLVIFSFADRNYLVVFQPKVSAKN